MLHLTFAAGLRVSELIGLCLDQIDRRDWANIHVLGKGRREWALPLWKETATTLKAWIALRPPDAALEIFLNAAGRAMTRNDIQVGRLRSPLRSRQMTAMRDLADIHFTPQSCYEYYAQRRANGTAIFTTSQEYQFGDQ